MQTPHTGNSRYEEGIKKIPHAALTPEDVKLLQPISNLEIEPGFGAPDLTPLIAEGIPGAGLVPDATKYFWYHHTHADTIDKLDKDEFNKSVAVMAVITYVVAQMDENLPR